MLKEILLLTKIIFKCMLCFRLGTAAVTLKSYAVNQQHCGSCDLLPFRIIEAMENKSLHLASYPTLQLLSHPLTHYFRILKCVSVPLRFSFPALSLKCCRNVCSKSLSLFSIALVGSLEQELNQIV